MRRTIFLFVRLAASAVEVLARPPTDWVMLTGTPRLRVREFRKPPSAPLRYSLVATLMLPVAAVVHDPLTLSETDESVGVASP